MTLPVSIMNPGQDQPTFQAEISLPVRREAPQTSRDFANRVLCSRTALPSRVIDDVTVAVSELVTASYLARASKVDLVIEIHPDHVAAIVRDDGFPSRDASSNTLRESLLDALTTSRVVSEDAGGVVTVARFSTTLAR